ncbi:type III-B CRISPR-associated protein Cas10/Cmr2 [Nitrospirillum amazonense]|uniref:type III-B CRISPR-associated protein Cas10/Cmr2 n=1 Tax=Nitrospirillum amazonense TaxID=28077 RepID=UPI001645BE9A|nr:type III-B CRISPR-associated protein Cas10/Cmr2 [Nitrospirillum amazonense]
MPDQDVLLRVKLGPVQGFIRQARRTRDLWAGSFLLSWLTGKAMAAVAEQGGRITFPALDGDVMWAALRSSRSDGGPQPGPAVATLPNQFTVDVDGLDGEELGKAAVEAVKDAWEGLAKAVWDTFLKGVEGGNGTREIWDRQIEGFWRVTWTIGDADAASGRGHWRFADHLPLAEGGDHCGMMGDYQELSGHVRARGGAKAQDAFWNAVRGRVSAEIYKKEQPHGSLELGRSERLCAIALVKRLFPLLPLGVLQCKIGWLPVQQGWENGHTTARRLRKYPSTAFMAALPWLLKTIEHSGNQGQDGLTAADAFQREVVAIARRADVTDLDSGDSDFDALAIDPLLTNAGKLNRLHTTWPGKVPKFFALDGTLFFEEGIARRQEELRGNRRKGQGDSGGYEDLSGPQAVAVTDLQAALRALQTATAPEGGRRQRKMLKASPHYALLRMDGDNIGKLLAQGKKDEVSRALALFTQGAQGILNQGFGLPLYLGGDDVLALLPLHTALGVAEELRLAFLAATVAADCPGPTLSGGVVFAHYTTPLGQVLDLSKELLDQDAKVANDRDSLAMAVLKSSGEVARWVTKWNKPGNAVMALRRLTVDFAQDDERSSSLIHNLGQRLADLFRDGSDAGLSAEDLASLLLAERLRGRGTDDRAAAEAEMRQLTALCHPAKGGFTLAPALIAKFLADNGGWYGASDREGPTP